MLVTNSAAVLDPGHPKGCQSDPVLGFRSPGVQWEMEDTDDYGMTRAMSRNRERGLGTTRREISAGEVRGQVLRVILSSSRARGGG